MVSSTPPKPKADQSGLDTEVGAEDIQFNDPLQLIPIPTVPTIPFPQIKGRLLDLHSSLAKLPSLDPSAETNQLFAALVALVSGTPYANTAALARACALDPTIQEIQPDLIRICAEAEGKLELWWARKISCGNSADGRYLFPYYENYAQLARLEYHVLVGLGADPRPSKFEFEDPLQNSSLDPSGSVPPWKVTNVDILPAANAAALAFCTTAFPSLLSSGNYNFLTSSALDLPPPLLASFDTIYIAALVGLSPTTKLRVVAHIANHMRPGAYLVLRSAHRLRSLIYPQIDEDALLEAGGGRLAIQASGNLFNLMFEAVLHPKNEVVNSVLVARRI
ncbi:Nicotianamine synthase [Mycena rebaudengoi]|nr:Nicotianamine synthase [Mycena rebaudengoi]